MLLQNKRLFVFLCVVAFTTLSVALVLFMLPPTVIKQGSAIPESPHLASLPPQTDSMSEFTATIADLPPDMTYTQTRNLQDTMAYLVNPDRKGGRYQASYRDGSQETLLDGSIVFLIDVPSAKKTFIVYDNSQVRCAPQADQKEPDWQCETAPQDSGEYE